MANLEQKLQALRDGKSKKFKGISVQRDGEKFYIEGELYNLEDTIGIIQESGSTRQRFAYDRVAFLIVRPPATVVSSHQIRDRQEHVALLDKAKKKKYYVYYADVVQKNGKYYAVQPWIVDWESVDNIFGSPSEWGKDASTEELDDSDQLCCPFCGKLMSSTSGRTLHVKSKHPRRYKKYMASK